MKILAFAGSNSSTSINRQLVNFAVNRLAAKTDADVTELDLNDFEMPIYSADRENANGIPQLAHNFKAHIENADLVMISFAEHNGSYSAAYKNIFDWTSRIDAKVYADKQMILLATSPGKGGAASVLSSAVNSIPHFGGTVVGQLSIPSFNAAFDTEKGILNDSTELDEILDAASK